MPVLQWNDRYLIGIAQIDTHHQHLFFLVNRTYDDFINKVPRENLSILFDELIDYATYHFSMEEHWMRESSYPSLSLHQREHALFAQRVTEMQTSFHSGDQHLTLEALSFLHNWLTTHILQSDGEYGRFIAAARGRGIPSQPVH